MSDVFVTHFKLQEMFETIHSINYKHLSIQ